MGPVIDRAASAWRGRLVRLVVASLVIAGSAAGAASVDRGWARRTSGGAPLPRLPIADGIACTPRLPDGRLSLTAPGADRDRDLVCHPRHRRELCLHPRCPPENPLC